MFLDRLALFVLLFSCSWGLILPNDLLNELKKQCEVRNAYVIAAEHIIRTGGSSDDVKDLTHLLLGVEADRTVPLFSVNFSVDMSPHSPSTFNIPVFANTSIEGNVLAATQQYRLSPGDAHYDLFLEHAMVALHARLAYLPLVETMNGLVGCPVYFGQHPLETTARFLAMHPMLPSEAAKFSDKVLVRVGETIARQELWENQLYPVDLVLQIGFIDSSSGFDVHIPLAPFDSLEENVYHALQLHSLPLELKDAVKAEAAKKLAVIGCPLLHTPYEFALWRANATVSGMIDNRKGVFAPPVEVNVEN